MQRIQVSRGNIKYRHNQLPLLEGEFHVELGSKTDEKAGLYVGIQAGENYEYNTKEIHDADGNIIAGPKGAYARVGSAGSMGFKGIVSDKTFLTPTGVTRPGAVYLIGKDLQLTKEEADLFTNLNGDGDSASSNVELKKGDLILFNGANWTKIGGGSNASFDTAFSNQLTNAVSNVSNVQDAIVALDSKKLQYNGDLKVLDAADQIYTIDKTSSIPQLTAESGEVCKAFGEVADWGNVEGSYWSIKTPCTIDGTLYEEGDFLSITATKPWSQRAQIEGDPSRRSLLGTDISINKIVGGTRDAEKIKVHADQFTRPNGLYAEEDAALTHVQGALNTLFTTKADVGPDGKVPVSQLPDTVIGGMDYQGTWADNTKLPTDSDKVSGEALQKGDYWIYSGDEWDITSDANFDGYTPEEAEKKRFVKKGDWIIYNNSPADPKWSVIDNTDAFIGVTDNAGTTTLDGIVHLKGATRNVSPELSDVVEVATAIDESSTGIQFTAPNAVLEPTLVDENTILKAGPAKTAVKSNVSEAADKLTIAETNGITVANGAIGAETTKTVNITVNPDQTSSDPASPNNIDVKLPTTSGTLMTDAGMGLSEGTDFFAAMFQNKALRDSFLKFLTTTSAENPSTTSFEGISLVDPSQVDAPETKILLGKDGNGQVVGTTQILPVTSGYLLNSNSIIDCGLWTEGDAINPYGNMEKEGHVVPDNTNRDAVNTVDYNTRGTNNKPEEIIQAYVVE